MRLIHTLNFTLHEFHDSVTPKYAILSHTWGSEEITFQDIQSGRGIGMTSFAKIKGCCAQAASDGLEYAWIDTCCIDKSSSAELSEAINSMFLWYQKARICYAYLSDVSEGDGNPLPAGSTFRESRWFTRGWTLQELLAPLEVVFYNHDWNEIGTKSSLQDVIRSVTGIKDLSTHFRSASIAQKMSWASKRQTTREEDIAYCLMGLFGVYMPPLYGEGNNAFKRLQLEIISNSDDESIFAWKDGSTRDGGFLARSPTAFKDSGDIIEMVDFSVPKRPPYWMTNRGLRIELEFITRPGVNLEGLKMGVPESAMTTINCKRQGKNGRLALSLCRWSRDEYTRDIDLLHEWTGEMNQGFNCVYVVQDELQIYRNGYWRP